MKAKKSTNVMSTDRAKHFLTTIMILVFFQVSSQTTIYLSDTSPTTGETTSIPGTSYVKMKPGNPYPSMVRMAAGSNVQDNDFLPWLASAVNLQEGHNFLIKDVETYADGFTRHKLVQTYLGIPIDIAIYNVHSQEGFLTTFGGRSVEISGLSPEPVYNEDAARREAISYVGATKYAWEDPELEQELKEDKDDPDATYFPSGEMVWRIYRDTPYLTWRFDIFSLDPDFEQRVYINAVSGEIVTALDLEATCDAAGVTDLYNYGGITIYTEEHKNGEWRLRDDCQNAKIRIRDWNSNTLKDNKTEITDDNNTWTTNAQRFGATVLFGIRNSIDYFMDAHARDSYDGQGGDIDGYISALFSCPDGSDCISSNNASMNSDGRLKVGFGRNLPNSYGCQDIMAHEFTHALTRATSDLEYEGESGALNESFSDIFGEVIERWQFGVNDWLIGGDWTDIEIRNMADPARRGQPDTYLSSVEWFDIEETCDQANDKCGVHTNSGVQNYWFYLLCEGGSGTNDNDDNYQIDAIGMDKARRIAYRTLVSYLGPNSDYFDARESSIQAAIDYYGHCSEEVKAVTNAWHAVGVGERFVWIDAAVISSYNDQDVSCYGSCDGMIWALGGGWNAPDLDTILTGLCPGEYNLANIADNYCVDIVSVEVTEPDTLIAIALLDGELGDEFGISCAGASDGKLKVEVIGGTHPFTYLWSTGEDSSHINGLPAGDYTVTVTDANGCAAEGWVTLREPELIIASVLITSDYNGYNVSCYAAQDGSIEVIASDGIQPYHIFMNDGGQQIPGDQFNGLRASKTYKFDVYDDKGCHVTTEDRLTQPDELTIEAYGGKTVYLGYPDSACAFLSSEVFGGVPPYSIEWSTGELSDDINVCPDSTTNYVVTVTDANGCRASDEVRVCVIDVRCGKKLNKIMVCQVSNGNNSKVISLCLTPQVAGIHLNQGDLLGSCDANRTCSENQSRLNVHQAFAENESYIEVFPNPFMHSFTVRHLPEADGFLTLEMIDISGRVIDVIFSGEVENTTVYDFSYTGNALPAGMYFIRLETSDGMMTLEKLVHNKPR